jgi:hypothetical protein
MKVSQMIALLKDLEEQEGNVPIYVGNENLTPVTGVWMKDKKNRSGRTKRVVALATGLLEE